MGVMDYADYSAGRASDESLARKVKELESALKENNILIKTLTEKLAHESRPEPEPASDLP